MSYQQFLFFDWLILCPGNLILHQKKKEMKMIKTEIYDEKRKQQQK